MFPRDKANEFEKYPLVTAEMLSRRKERPRRVKMLMRDFIEGSSSSEQSLASLPICADA